MSLRPLRDMVLLRPDMSQVGKVGGIWMPELGNLSCKVTGEADVIAAGPKVEHCTVGKRVRVEVYDKHFAGDEVEIDGEKLILIRERDICGLVV